MKIGEIIKNSPFKIGDISVSLRVNKDEIDIFTESLFNLEKMIMKFPGYVVDSENSKVIKTREIVENILHTSKSIRHAEVQISKLLKKYPVKVEYDIKERVNNSQGKKIIGLDYLNSKHDDQMTLSPRINHSFTSTRKSIYLSK